MTFSEFVEKHEEEIAKVVRDATLKLLHSAYNGLYSAAVQDGIEEGYELGREASRELGER